MLTVTVDEAKIKLQELIHKVLFGEEVYIRLADNSSVQLTKVKQFKQPRKAGCLKGLIKIKDDFNAVPDGFEDYTH